MLTNDQMKANRYLRWHKARSLVNRIQSHLLAGGTVIMVTYARATLYTAKHADWFTATKHGAYVKSGKSRVCIDYAEFLYH